MFRAYFSGQQNDQGKNREEALFKTCFETSRRADSKSKDREHATVIVLVGVTKGNQRTLLTLPFQETSHFVDDEVVLASVAGIIHVDIPQQLTTCCRNRLSLAASRRQAQSLIKAIAYL